MGATLKTATPCPKPNGPNPRYTTFKSAPPNCLDPGKNYEATFVTTEGNIVVELDTTKTPMTANNFIVLARYHYYDGTSMFRTDTSIDIIQGGSPHTQDASDPGPGYTIKDEGSGFKYTLGDLTMARTSAAQQRQRPVLLLRRPASAPSSTARAPTSRSATPPAVRPCWRRSWPSTSTLPTDWAAHRAIWSWSRR